MCAAGGGPGDCTQKHTGAYVVSKPGGGGPHIRESTSIGRNKRNKTRTGGYFAASPSASFTYGGGAQSAAAAGGYSLPGGVGPSGGAYGLVPVPPCIGRIAFHAGSTRRTKGEEGAGVALGRQWGRQEAENSKKKKQKKSDAHKTRPIMAELLRPDVHAVRRRSGNCTGGKRKFKQEKYKLLILWLVPKQSSSTKVNKEARAEHHRAFLRVVLSHTRTLFVAGRRLEDEKKKKKVEIFA
ncbi:hypothetical protein B0H14DRAFT_2565258 [Mycena olivaceomarginata]|nr:hypothetical protein B0H14DRAFT_2565258 [Mycena olivaceomarginata]